jgi:hypothetical protein
MADKEKEVTPKVPALDPATMELIRQLAAQFKPDSTLEVEKIKAIVSELKRDPEAEAKRAQALEQRKQMQKSQEEFVASQKAVKKACTHTRADGSYNIAWMPYADRVPRGVCQVCNDLFDPTHDMYEHLLKNSTQGYTLYLN